MKGEVEGKKVLPNKLRKHIYLTLCLFTFQIDGLLVPGHFQMISATKSTTKEQRGTPEVYKHNQKEHTQPETTLELLPSQYLACSPSYVDS